MNDRKMWDPLPLVSKILVFLGRPIPGEVKVRYLIMTVSSIIMFSQSFLFLVMRFSDLKSRLLAFEDMVILFYISAILIDFALKPNKVLTIMATIKKRHFNLKEMISEEQKAVLEDLERKAQRTTKLLIITVTCYTLANFILPISSGLITFLAKNRDIQVDAGNHTLQRQDAVKSEKANNEFEDYPLPVESWYPFSIARMPIYLTLCLIQGTYLGVEGMIFACWIVLILCAFLTVEMELKFLCQSFREIDLRVEKYVADQKNVIVDGNEDDLKNKYLRIYLRNLVLHHQSIIEVVNELNRASSFLVFMFNQIISCQICMSLFGSQVDDKVLKLKYRILAIPILFSFGMFCYYGQGIGNEDEEMRKAVLHCSWERKPLWFKKDLLLILTRLNKPLEIKPLGLYVLNLRNFAVILNASYSYYNLLHTTELKNR
ncbi:odorant receptor 4-like isoform X1 [Nilaparvata lugens]|uniref:odorant receptor 4-like isoform X1 n=1 Tax=Nilaparvata lugens TaxID=108931 RepID=UPI00193E0ABA|nr:odorant receptor 4-like isoform X1 [Nilaparvata lugens]